MPKRLIPSDYIGKENNRLKVIDVVMKESGTQGKKRSFLICECSCGSGKLVHVVPNEFDSGHTKSCGCLNRQSAIERNTKHGQTPRNLRTRLYRIWAAMKSRCGDPNTPRYLDYGGRGIKVCAQWSDSFTEFQEWALSNGYNDKLSIDRIDNNKGYCPNNCRWATDKEQAQNQRIVKRNKSGVKGVSYCRGKWQATLRTDDRRVYLGVFNTIEEAAKALEQGKITYQVY